MSTKIQLSFFCTALFFVLSTVIEPYPFSWFVKLIPMGILISFVFKHMKTPSEKLFLFGLIASAFGDFFLDYDRINWFIFGLGSFLIAHIFYLFALKPIERKKDLIIILYMIYGTAMFWLISAGLGELFIPVFVYMTVLLIMAIVTLVSTKSNKWLIIGGLSFVISDSLIGINKFYLHIPYSHFMIMITYYLAQFSLVKGLIKS